MHSMLVQSSTTKRLPRPRECVKRSLVSVECFDFGADFLQTIREIRVAAIDWIHIAEHALALCGEHANEEQCRGAERGRRFHIGTAERGGPGDECAMHVEQLDLSTQLIHFGLVLCAA